MLKTEEISEQQRTIVPDIEEAVTTSHRIPRCYYHSDDVM